MRKILVALVAVSLVIGVDAAVVSQTIDERVARAKAEAQRQVDAGIIQGAVFTANGFPVIAVGYQCVKPVKKPMTVDSRFDMASVGKQFTAACCALLMCDGKLDVDAPFTRYLPEHVLSKTNCDITVRDMGMHSSGFSNNKPYSGIRNDMKRFNEKFYANMPVRPRMAAFEYSCFNFISLGKIINALTGKDLDEYARLRIWGPLGMKNTQWHAPGDGPNEVEHWFPNRPAGQHNDGVCYDCPEPLGNGSCFSTAGDMMLFVQDFLDRRTFPKEYYDLLMTPGFERDGYRRTFGWEMTDKHRPAGLSKKAIFHTGWSGQTICVDPENNFAAVVLTSRTGDYEKARTGRAKIISILFGCEQP